MIEFHVKIRVNTQSPEIAHEHLRAALSYSGLSAEINDVWMQNNRKLPTHVAQQIADAWSRGRDYVDPAVTLRGSERFEDRYIETDSKGAVDRVEHFNRRTSD